MPVEVYYREFDAETLCCTSSGRLGDMDFTFTEEQETVSKLARDVFERRATPERLTELEAGEVRYDAALWKELAASDLLGTALPESLGGNGGGFVELGVLLAEVGSTVAPVPAYATLLLGADPIARHGNPEQQQRFLPGVIDGSRILSAGSARARPIRPDQAGHHRPPRRRLWRLDGVKELVSFGQLADTVVIPATIDDGADGAGLFLLPTDASGVEIRSVATTNREPHADRLPRRRQGLRRHRQARRRRAGRVALHPRAGRAVRGPGRRVRSCAADGRRIHHGP